MAQVNCEYGELDDKKRWLMERHNCRRGQVISTWPPLAVINLSLTSVDLEPSRRHTSNGTFCFMTGSHVVQGSLEFTK